MDRPSLVLSCYCCLLLTGKLYPAKTRGAHVMRLVSTTANRRCASGAEVLT
jgi:hypothetical protein